MNRTFWPVMLIVLGGLLLINTVLGVNLPVFKLALAFGLVWGGITLLSGGVFHRIRDSWHGFGGHGFGSTMKIKGEALEYSVAFDESVLDLSREEVHSSKLKISCAFGKASVILPRDRAVHIKASGAFCTLRAPNGKAISFGEGTYDIGFGEPLHIDADCAFGELAFCEADQA